MSTKYLNDAGLSVVIDMLKSLTVSAQQGIEILQLVNALADAVVNPSTGITIPSSGWLQDDEATSEDVKMYRDVPVQGISEADSVDVALDYIAFGTAWACRLCPTVETHNGFLRFKAAQPPTTSITGVYRVSRGSSEEAS